MKIFLPFLPEKYGGFYFLLIVFTVSAQPSSVVISSQQNTGKSDDFNGFNNKCELIAIPLCQDLLYNKTIFPNLMGHTKQDEAALEVHQFIPLIKINCSPDLKLFLCSLYSPLCTTNYPSTIPPCRKLCESARVCEKIMKTFDFMWPESLECSKFPEDGKDEICISPNTSSSSKTISPSDSNLNVGFTSNVKEDKKHQGSKSTSVYSHRFRGFICPLQLKIPSAIGAEFNIGGKTVKNCGIPCNSLFFTDEDRSMLRYIISTMAALCVLCCLFTVFTFIVDSSRFRYPERPICFLAICFLFVGCAFIVGFTSGDSLACRDPFMHNVRLGKLQMISTITQGHQGHISCTVSFMILYFCLMAAFAWFVFFALSWLLASGFKWGHEAIEARSHIFHLFAWGLPALQTVCILALGKVEGDVLSGVCFVGTLSSHSLALFVLIPTVIYVGIGTFIFLVGFFALFRIRTVMKSDGTRTDKLEKLMLRIGVFSTLFVIPSVLYLATITYEYVNFDDWMLQWNRMTCKKFSIPCPPSNIVNETNKPIFSVFIIKYVSLMLIGITSGLTWLCSSKTIASWKSFFNRTGRKPVSGNFV